MGEPWSLSPISILPKIIWRDHLVRDSNSVELTTGPARMCNLQLSKPSHKTQIQKGNSRTTRRTIGNPSPIHQSWTSKTSSKFNLKSHLQPLFELFHIPGIQYCISWRIIQFWSSVGSSTEHSCFLGDSDSLKLTTNNDMLSVTSNTYWQ